MSSRSPRSSRSRSPAPSARYRSRSPLKKHEVKAWQAHYKFEDRADFMSEGCFKGVENPRFLPLLESGDDLVDSLAPDLFVKKASERERGEYVYLAFLLGEHVASVVMEYGWHKVYDIHVDEAFFKERVYVYMFERRPMDMLKVRDLENVATLKWLFFGRRFLTPDVLHWAQSYPLKQAKITYAFEPRLKADAIHMDQWETKPYKWGRDFLSTISLGEESSLKHTCWYLDAFHAINLIADDHNAHYSKDQACADQLFLHIVDRELLNLPVMVLEDAFHRVGSQSIGEISALTQTLQHQRLASFVVNFGFPSTTSCIGGKTQANIGLVEVVICRTSDAKSK